MRLPAVTIVVPCFNGGRFLAGLFSCLNNQTFRDFDVIVVDDGSTDDETIRQLAALGSSAFVVKQRNLGLPAARNAGISKATGKYILPLDCDDRLEPTFLAETVRAIENATSQTGFAFTHMRVQGYFDGVLVRRCIFFDQLFLNQLPYCMLLRKTAWEHVGGYDESFRDGYEDWEFNIRLIANGWAGIEIKQPLFVYRASDTGMLLSGAARKHGMLWNRIKAKNSSLYRFAALMQIWKRCAPEHGKVGLVTAFGLSTLSQLLPEQWFGSIFRIVLLTRYRSRRGLQPTSRA